MRCVLGMAVQERAAIKTSHVVPEIFYAPWVGVLGPALPSGAQPAPEEADAPAQHQRGGAWLYSGTAGKSCVVWLHLNRLATLQGTRRDAVRCLLQSPCPAPCWSAST